MKKRHLVVITTNLLLTASLAACGNNSENASSTSSKTETAQNVSSISTNNDSATFKNNTFTIKGMEFKITGVKTFPSAADQNKKTLVLETDITNNTDKVQDVITDVNPYMWIHATQNTDNTEKELQPGTLAIDENTGNSPEQQREDNMNSSKILPHKTMQGMISFDTVNRFTSKSNLCK